MADLWIDVDTAVTVPVNLMPLIDSTDFKTIEEAVVFNQAGLDLVWNFVTTAGVMTQTAVTPTDTAGDYDWTNVGNGLYKIEIPASAGASINNDTEGFGWFTGFATGILPWRGPVIGFRAAGLNNLLVDDAFSATRGLAGTALPAAAADAAGGLPISDAGGLDLDARIGTDIPAILVDTAEIGVAGAGLTNINLPNQTMDITGNITGNLSGSVGSVTAGVTLAASAVQAIWDALTSALTTVGSIGKLLVDNIDAAISSRLSTAGYTAPPSVGAIADQVWDEAIAGHLGAGSTGAALNAAGSAGDPWTTPLPGAYGAGTAGNIVGTNLNATVDSRATQASVDTIDTNVDTLLTRITATLFANITSLAQWLGLMAGKQVGDTTARTEVRATGAGSGTFDETTDSQEAIRDKAADIETDTQAIEADTQDLQSRIGTPSNLGSGATVSANLVDIEGQTDDIGVAGAGLTALGDTRLANLDAAISTRATPAQVNTEADQALADVGVTTTVTGRIDAAISTRAPEAGGNIAAIKAKTDNLPETIQKNVALANFTFLMVDSADGRTGKTGLTVTATRRLDAGAFAACANSVTEVSGGFYTIDLAASDLNGDIVTLLFTASGADDTRITLTTAT